VKSPRSRAFAALLLSLALAACGTTAPSSSGGTSAPASGPVGSGITGDDVTLTTLVATFGDGKFAGRDSHEAAGGELNLVMATLLGQDKDGKLGPGIAESWEMAPDGLSWTFKIRDGVKFHNGDLVTAEDVAFSLTDTFGPEAAEVGLTGTVVVVAKEVVSIEATDAKTVQVKFKTPIPHFGSLVSSMQDGAAFGAIMPKAYFEKVGREGFHKAPIGAGTFKLVERREAQDMTFERFDDYYNPAVLPKFKHYKIVAVPELATRVQALNGGTADIIQADLTVLDQITSAGHQVVFSEEAAYIWFMLVGCWKEDLPCHDKGVRQALDFALDKELIMGQLYGDAWLNAGWDLLGPSGLGYSEDLAPRKFDGDKARALLSEAGFPGGAGFPALIVNVDGASADAPRLPDFAQLVAQQWTKELGITVDVRVGDEGSLSEQMGGRQLDGQVFIRANSGRYDGGSIMGSIYGGDTTVDNHLSEDPMITAAVAEMRRAITDEDRQAAYNKLFELVQEETYQINTGSLNSVWGVSSRLEGWQPLALHASPSALWTITVKE
jgi:peptide/nickel transport system substrate-binding protein